MAMFNIIYKAAERYRTLVDYFGTIVMFLFVSYLYSCENLEILST